MTKHIVYIFLCFSLASIAQETIPDKEEMCTKLTEMVQNDRKYRSGKILKDGKFGRKSVYPKKAKDSVWKLQWKLDNKNTEQLIQLTQKYGWLSDERLNCPKLDIWLIFRHSQKKYYDKIDKLIEKEHTAKRLNDFQYKLIKDHVTGKY